MIRHTVLLSAMTLSLLLGACSGKHKDKVVTDEGATAQATVVEQPVADAPAKVTPPHREIDYWQYVAPLIAGNYRGTCMNLPDRHKLDSTILVGADGKASVNDLNVDLRAAKVATLERKRDDKGEYSTFVSVYAEDNKVRMPVLKFDQAGKDGAVNLARENMELECSYMRGAEKPNAQPLYGTLSKLLNAKKQAMSCIDSKTAMMPREFDVEVLDDVLTIGGTSFDLKAAVSALYMFGHDGGDTVILNIVIADEGKITLSYDLAGKLTVAQAGHAQDLGSICNLKD